MYDLSNIPQMRERVVNRSGIVGVVIGYATMIDSGDSDNDYFSLYVSVKTSTVSDQQWLMSNVIPLDPAVHVTVPGEEDGSLVVNYEV